nr:DUF2207 domain-containing protein [uncultured Cohaesibacter sp.]
MMLRSLFYSVIATLCLLFGMGSPEAFARERITDYQVAITVNTDRTVDITEVISVNVEGDQIKRGLLRDIPESYRGRRGTYVHINPTVRAVLRDGRSEPYQTSHEGRYFRLRIGDADVLLQNGVHTYEISYSVDDSIGFFDDYDEIYWNAIGTEWAFPIDAARVVVQLPDGASVLQYAVYTGSQGEKGNSYRVAGQSNNAIAFEATRRFDVGEGMTVAVGWPKGIVAEPTQTEQALGSVLDNSPMMVIILGAVLQFIWLVYSWIKVGKDPERGTVIPLFRAPDTMSPAIASYIYGMGTFEEGDQTSFMAALISLGTKGLISIKEEGKSVELHRTDNPGSTASGRKQMDSRVKSLPAGEKALFKALFKGRDVVKLKTMQYEQMSKIMSAFTSAIDKETGETYFHENMGKSFVGLMIAVVSMVLFVLLRTFLAPPFEFPILEVATAVFLGVFMTLFFVFAGALLPERISNGLKAIILAGLAIVAILIMVSEKTDVMPGSDFFAVGPTLLAVFMWLLAIAFYHWMKAPTLKGREIMDKVEGLKLFMTVTASEQAYQASAAGMPELTPKLYEDLLPYAIALGVERKWSKIFEKKVFSQMPPGQSYQPIWYAGHFDTSRPTASLAQVTDAIGTNLKSAMTPPASSSSGSSGGGSSGGGGGGGGGGGW